VQQTVVQLAGGWSGVDAEFVADGAAQVLVDG
jgi:hypothetical protein